MFGSGLGSVRVKFGFGSFSGRPCSGRVWLGLVKFGFSKVRVRVTYTYHVCISTGSVQVEFGSGLFRVVYCSPVRIRYGSNVILVNGIQFNIWVNIGSGINRIRYKSSWVNFESLYNFSVAIFS